MFWFDDEAARLLGDQQNQPPEQRRDTLVSCRSALLRACRALVMGLRRDLLRYVAARLTLAPVMLRIIASLVFLRCSGCGGGHAGGLD